MDLGLVAEIVTVILAIFGILLGYKYAWYKHKFHLFRKLIEELDNAWYDDTITEEELRKIIDALVRLKEEC